MKVRMEMSCIPNCANKIKLLQQDKARLMHCSDPYGFAFTWIKHWKGDTLIHKPQVGIRKLPLITPTRNILWW